MSDLPDIERAFVYEPKDGDRVVLEVDALTTAEEASRLKEVAENHLGCSVVVLAGAHLAGVIRG